MFQEERGKKEDEQELRELDGLKALMEQNSKFTVTYIAEVQK